MDDLLHKLAFNEKAGSENRYLYASWIFKSPTVQSERECRTLILAHLLRCQLVLQSITLKQVFDYRQCFSVHFYFSFEERTIRNHRQLFIIVRWLDFDNYIQLFMWLAWIFQWGKFHSATEHLTGKVFTKSMAKLKTDYVDRWVVSIGSDCFFQKALVEPFWHSCSWHWRLLHVSHLQSIKTHVRLNEIELNVRNPISYQILIVRVSKCLIW